MSGPLRGRQSKEVHDPSDFFEAARERIKNRPPPSGVSLTVTFSDIAEAYIDGLLQIHVHIEVWMRRGDPGPAYYCAIFDKAVRTSRLERHRTSGAKDSHHPLLEDNRTEMQKLMLVNDIQTMENPERVLVRRVPSIVRLQLLDRCLVTWPESGDLIKPAARLPTGELATRNEDRELRTCRRAHDSQTSELPSQMIEAGPEIVQDVSDNNSQVRIGWAADRQMKDILAGLSIKITAGTVGSKFVEPPYLQLKAVQVLLRPT